MSLHDEILADGFDLYWRRNASNVLVDAGTNPQTLTQHGTPTAIDALTTGQEGATEFDSGDGVFADLDAGLKVQTFTAVMVYQAGVSPAPPESIFTLQPKGASFPGSYNRGWSIRQFDGFMRFYGHGAALGYVQGTTDTRDDEPHLVVVTYDGSTLKLYVDGVREGAGGAGESLAAIDYSDAPAGAGPDPAAVILNGYHNVATASQEPNESQGAMAVDFVAVKAGTAVDATRVAEYWAAFAVPAAPVQPIYGRAYARVSTTAALTGLAVANIDTARLTGRAVASVRQLSGLGGVAGVSVDTVTDYSVCQRAYVRWAMRVEIDGVDRTDLWTGRITSAWEPAKPFTARFNLMPPAGALDPADYSGKSVRLVYRDLGNGGVNPYEFIVYTGEVVRAVWQPASGVLQCDATTASDRRFRDMPADPMARELGAEHSPYVYGDSSGWQLALDLFDSRQADIWLRPDGGVIATPWESAPADVEWVGGELFTASMRYVPNRRETLRNRVQVRMAYRYQRRRQRTLRCRWTMEIPICDAIINGVAFAQRSMINDAAAGNGGWQLVGGVSFEALPPPLPLRCFPDAPNPAQKYLLWGGDAEQQYALGAWWTISRRWLQWVTERRNIEIVAPQSIAANGLIEAAEDYAVVSERDNSAWLEQRGYTTAGDSYSVIAGSGVSDSSGAVLGDLAKTTDDSGPGNRTDYERAERVATAAVSAEMVRQYREEFRAKNLFDPRIKPGVRLRFNHRKGRVTGNVTGLFWVFDRDSTEATVEARIAPFNAFGQGLPNADPIEALPPVTLPAAQQLGERLYFGTHIGGRLGSPWLQDDWVGYFTNYETDPANDNPFDADPEALGGRLYPNQFRVRYPDLSEADQAAIEVGVGKRVAVAIPDDEIDLEQ